MKNKLTKDDNENSEYEYILSKSDELALQGKFKQALELLNEIPDDCEEYTESLFMKSLIIGFNGDEEKSFEIFKKFFAKLIESENVDMDGEQSRNESDILFEYGLSRFFKFEEYDKAIEYFDLSLKLNPNQSEVLFFKSLSFAFSGRLKKAVKIMDKAIKLDPDKSHYWHNKGAFLAELNFIGKAHNAFDKAISIEPNSDSWLNKGILYYRNENFDKAINCFDEAIKLNPNDIDSIVAKAASIRN